MTSPAYRATLLPKLQLEYLSALIRVHLLP